jgi:TolA-binding protein
MKIIRMLLCATIVALTLSCSGDKSKELLETAEFEERQHNDSHAKQLYEDVIRLYPSSKEADTARARLAALNRG